MTDITCLGEILIDFTSRQSGVSLIETPGFDKNAGGAPANVAVGVSRLGASSAFLGMVGDDEFGCYLAKMLADRGVDTSGLRFSDRAHTTLAFVALRADGEREFIFYRNPGADMLYGPADLDEALVAAGRIFHHGSISFISESNRAATMRAIEIAKAHSRMISYDPNLRLNLWPDAQAARAGIELGLPTADILKVSEEELVFITGEASVEDGIRAVQARGIPVILVTLGARGCAYAWGDINGFVPTHSVAAIDATGAGDAFIAGVLYRIVKAERALSDFRQSEIEDLLAFANAVAGLVVTRRGAIPAMPTLKEVQEWMQGNQK